MFEHQSENRAEREEKKSHDKLSGQKKGTENVKVDTNSSLKRILRRPLVRLFLFMSSFAFRGGGGEFSFLSAK
jgi:hypothetical protein